MKLGLSTLIHRHFEGNHFTTEDAGVDKKKEVGGERVPPLIVRHRYKENVEKDSCISSSETPARSDQALFSRVRQPLFVFPVFFLFFSFVSQVSARAPQRYGGILRPSASRRIV